MSEKPKETVAPIDFLNMSQEDIAKQVGTMMKQMNPNAFKAVKDAGAKSKSDNKANPIGAAMEIISDKKKWMPIVIVLVYVVGSGVVANVIWLTQLIKYFAK